MHSLAARLAAQHHSDIDPELIRRGRELAQGQDLKAMIDADMAFHQAVDKASGNSLIAQSAQQHWAHLRRVMGAVLQSAGQREAIWDEHAAIAQAIGRGDADLAQRLTEQHVQRAGQHLCHCLDEVLSAQKATAAPRMPGLRRI